MSVTYDILVFDQSALKTQLDGISKKALEAAIDSIGRHPDFQASDYYSIGNNMYEVVSGDLLAWVKEYGSGDDAQVSRNPYWGEYLHSGLTSPARSGPMAVRRGRGAHQSLNVDTGEIVTHEGANPVGGYLPTGFRAQFTKPAQPFLKEMFKEAYEEFKRVFNQECETIDINTFIRKETKTI